MFARVAMFGVVLAIVALGMAPRASAMALTFNHSAVQWLAADVAGTVYTVSGIQQPKALRAYWQGLGSATDAVSQTVHSRRGVGFATSTSDRRCVGSQEQDAAGTMVCTAGYRTDCLAMTLTSTPAVDGLLDLNSITSDGFTLIVDDQVPVDITVFLESWGGSDITVAVTGEIVEPAATGNVDYTVTGFGTTDSDDQVVMFAGCSASAAAPTAIREDSVLMVGFSTGPTTQNIVVFGSTIDAKTTEETAGYCRTSVCIANHLIDDAATMNAEAALTQFNADGFRLNWTLRGLTNRKYIFLAIKGGNWRAGAYTIAGNTLNATTSVASLPFTPVGVSLVGRMTAQDAAQTPTAQNRLSLGSGSATTSRRSMGTLAEEGTTSAEIDLTMQYDQVLCYPSNAGALLTAYDISAMAADGFTIINDLAGGVASEWHGYLTFGSVAVTDTGEWMCRTVAERSPRVVQVGY